MSMGPRYLQNVLAPVASPEKAKVLWWSSDTHEAAVCMLHIRSVRSLGPVGAQFSVLDLAHMIPT